MFSIAEQCNSAVVLLTGATGYVGGLVLESLLRTTNVAKVFVVLREKGASGAGDRLSQLLQVGGGWQLRQLRDSCTHVSTVHLSHMAF
jgi:thioester reductase-like protein